MTSMALPQTSRGFATARLWPAGASRLAPVLTVLHWPSRSLVVGADRRRRSARREFRCTVCSAALGLTCGRCRYALARARPTGAVVDPAAAHRACGHGRRHCWRRPAPSCRDCFAIRSPIPALVGVSSGGALAAATTIVIGDALARAARRHLADSRSCRSPPSPDRWRRPPLLYRIATRESRTSIAIFLLGGLASRRWPARESAFWCSSPTIGNCATSRSGCSARSAARPGPRSPPSHRSCWPAAGVAAMLIARGSICWCWAKRKRFTWASRSSG